MQGKGHKESGLPGRAMDEKGGMECRTMDKIKTDIMAENKKEEWHWQEKGTAWKGVGIYHVTLTVTSREPLLGRLVIPDNDPKKARVDLSDFGIRVKTCVDDIPAHHPEVRILQLRMMPDHIHMILHVKRTMPVGIKTVVRGLWQGVKRVGRELTMSISSNSIRNNERCYPIFTEMPFIRPMSRHGQLEAMIRYLQMNPERLATKRLMPEFFRVQEGIEIAGRKYSGVGNVELLQRARYKPVHVRSMWVEDSERHGYDQPLRDYMNGCVIAARQGAVMVSPFISKQEQAVMAVLLKEELPFIYIADNGFGEYYKPSAALYDAVAAKRVLILSPWEYDADKKHVSRADCVAMNKMAEEICTLSEI